MKKELAAAAMAAVMLILAGCAGNESDMTGTSAVTGEVSTDNEVMSLAESMAESMFESRMADMTDTTAESTAAVTAPKPAETAETVTETEVTENPKSISHTFCRMSEEESRTVTIDSDVYPFDCEEMTIFVDSDAQRDFGAEGYLYIDLKNLKDYPDLKRLEIGDLNGMAGGYIKIINGGSAAGLENLEEIELHNCTWWEEDWLSGIGSLRKLSIIGCRYYEGELLENLTQVETLCFDMCPIRDLSFINGMSSLNELVLTFARLNNTSFDGVEDNYSVKKVTIGLNHIYDSYDDSVLKDIAGLGKFKKLEYLKIPETEFIDDKVKALQDVLPECEIHDFMEDR